MNAGLWMWIRTEEEQRIPFWWINHLQEKICCWFFDFCYFWRFWIFPLKPAMLAGNFSPRIFYTTYSNFFLFNYRSYSFLTRQSNKVYMCMCDREIFADRYATGTRVFTFTLKKLFFVGLELNTHLLIRTSNERAKTERETKIPNGFGRLRAARHTMSAHM